METDASPTDPPRKTKLDDFHVVDAKTASWVARKINEARAHQQRVKAWAERELKRARRREQFLLARFGNELETWTRNELARSSRKSKTIDLPGGRLCFRLTRPTLVVTDEKMLLVWAKSNLPTAIKTIESVVKTALNRHLADTGECADGTDLRCSEERFHVR